MSHLKSIKIENYRIFNDATSFELAPITVLTGPNNSGKSSLIKMLKLMGESFSIKDNLNELQFQNGSSNLGSFSNSISWNSKKEFMKITIPLPLDYFDENFTIDLVYRKNNKNNGELNYFKIYNKNRILVEFNNNPSFAEFYSEHVIKQLSQDEINNFKRAKNNQIKNIDLGYLIKTVFKLKDKALKEDIERDSWDTPFGNYEDISFYSNLENAKPDLVDFNSVFYSFFERKTSSQNLDTIKKISDAKILDFYKGEEIINNNPYYKELINNRHSYFLTRSKNISHSYLDFYEMPSNSFDWFYKVINDHFNNRMKVEDNLTAELSSLGRVAIKTLFVENIQNAVARVGQIFASINHLPANRGEQSRVNFSQHHNHLNNLFDEFIILQQSENVLDEIFKFIQTKFIELEIGELHIKKLENNSINSKIKLLGTNQEVLLADLGFGYSQIVPILLKIGIIAFNRRLKTVTQYGHEYQPSVFILEEPEANLHPNLQSKLAGVLVDAAKEFNIQFIIETHSEYIIRKLQYLTAKKKLDKRDTQLFYFHKPNQLNNKENQIKKMNIRADGMIDDSFGKGFLDESMTLTMDLLKLQSLN